MSNRQEFPKTVKLAAWTRAAGQCEKCGTRLFYGHYHYDHIKPCAFEGKPTTDNCQVLCSACHLKKTKTEDIPRIAKSNRQRNKNIGIKKPSRPIVGSKASGWKHNMDGSWVRR